MENMNNTLRTLLANNIVRFTYRKADGTLRNAIGTRNLSLVYARTGVSVPAPRGAENPNAYFDLEKMAWRSYRSDSLVRIDGVEDRDRLPKREIPKEKPIDLGLDGINDIVRGLFGGIGLGNEPTLGKPTDMGIGIGVPAYGVSVEDFAKMVADKVVENLVARLSK